MPAVNEFAAQGKPVIGICNGFQILCEAGLLPGVLMRNDHLQFRCQWVNLRVENANTLFTNHSNEGDVIRVPISHGEGNYFAQPEVIRELFDNNRVAFRYCDSSGEITDQSNPNGSLLNIAGITNERGNVLGMMPHPERCCDELLGGTDGRAIFQSIINSVLAGQSLAVERS
jgi:phosphoribosylformylglycinamidine synthase